MPKTLQIIQLPQYEKELRMPSKALTKQEILSSMMQEFFDDLLFTLDHSKEQVGIEGVGLSAVQVNKHVRVFWAYNIKTNKPRLYINPEVTILDPTEVVGEEGCLSIPDRFGYVARPRRIKVAYLDRRAVPHEVELKGFNARIVLHELDHLNGVLFIDKIVEAPQKDNLVFA